MHKWLFGFILLLASTTLLAETRYVVDELIITVRSGPSGQHQIVKLINSGASLNVIEEIENNGKQYAHVQNDDLDGWVLSQYLSTTPIARAQLQAAQVKAQKHSEENSRLKKQLAELQRARSTVEKQRDQLKNDSQQLDKQLSKLKRVSARPLEIEKNNEQLRNALAQNLNKVKLLSQENADLKSRDDREWFIAGAGVVLFSILFGIILTKIRWQRRSSWAGGSL